MKKKFLGLAIIAMSLVSFSGMAQNTTSSTSAKVENVKAKKGQNKSGRSQNNPFEGLTLTDAQQSQLQQLNENRKAARQQQMQAQKGEKQGNDSTRFAARKAAKKEYLEEVKAIIGPDQYVMFLENVYVNGSGNNRSGKAIQQGKSGNQKGYAHNRGGKGNSKKGGQRSGQRNSTSSATNSQS